MTRPQLSYLYSVVKFFISFLFNSFSLLVILISFSVLNLSFSFHLSDTCKQVGLAEFLYQDNLSLKCSHWTFPPFLCTVHFLVSRLLLSSSADLVSLTFYGASQHFPLILDRILFSSCYFSASYFFAQVLLDVPFRLFYSSPCYFFRRLLIWLNTFSTM